MPTERKCPQCGATLPSGALEGLCPACLLKEGATADTATQGGARPFQPPTVEEIARLFPGLQVLEFIGKGGMGAVYKARQPALDRVVALKILPPQAGRGTGFTERFNREARALAKLSHPNIVAVHEFGQVDGMPFFIMEFVDGLNLRQLERTGRLSPREALQIVPQICEALQFAHDEGIVHRDIKPENILLDKKGRVKIADFGIAKLVGIDPRGIPLTPSLSPSGGEGDSAKGGSSEGEAFALTEMGKTIGTPQYMAPEQKSEPQSVDHRADIYSLGVVFYEMLTGELPTGKFVPPSRKVTVDVRLDEVVLRALEREPERRYQQASEFKTGVETIATGAGVKVTAQGPLPSGVHSPPPDQVIGPSARGIALTRMRDGKRVPNWNGVSWAFLMTYGCMALVTILLWVVSHRRFNLALNLPMVMGLSITIVSIALHIALGGRKRTVVWVFGAFFLLVAGLLAGFIELQKPRILDTMAMAVSPVNSAGGQFEASGVTVGAMRIFGNDKYTYRFVVRDSQGKIIRQDTVPIPYNRLRMDPEIYAGPITNYHFGTHGQIRWEPDASSVAFLMRGVVIARLRIDTASPTAQASVQKWSPPSGQQESLPGRVGKAWQSFWTPAVKPGSKPDLQKVLAEARDLATEGKYEDALQRHLWYHNHALEVDPAHSAVRLSFGLSGWYELGRKYPKAKQAFIEVRDLKTAEFEAGGGFAELFAEVSAFNGYLQNDDATVLLFKNIEKRDPALARRCYFHVEDLLVQRKEYELCLRSMGGYETRFEVIKTVRTVDKRRAIEDTRKLIEILVGAGRKTEAQKIQDEAMALFNDERLKTAVSDAEEKIRK